MQSGTDVKQLAPVTHRRETRKRNSVGPEVLQKFYTVYDAERQRIGFGRARHRAETATVESWATMDPEDWWLEAEDELAEEEDQMGPRKTGV